MRPIVLALGVALAAAPVHAQHSFAAGYDSAIPTPRAVLGYEVGERFAASVPGAIVRVVGDTLSPLLAGGDEREFAALVLSDRSYAAPRDLRAGEAVVRYAPQPRLWLSGYLWPESAARLADGRALWTERVGQGRVAGLAGDPNFRDLRRGWLPIVANAVRFGASC
jgi:hypothetical protein